MLRRIDPPIAALFACAFALGCGGREFGPEEPGAELPPVDPAARAEHDAAQEILREGGDDAAERAADRFEAATAIDETFWEAWYNLGAYRLELGELGAAERAFSEVLALRPRHTSARLGRAEARRALGDGAGAREDYEQILDRRPDDDRAAPRLASLLREHERYEDALGAIRGYLREAGADAPIYVELGLIYRAQGRRELAELVLDQALELDGESPQAHNALALVALERGDDQRAFGLFDRAAELDPSHVDARYNKASVLMDAGDYAAAEAELDAVVAQRPNDFEARVALGVALRGNEDHEGARAMWEGVVAEAPRPHPSRGDALYNLAILELDFERDVDAGVQALERYLQNAPEDHRKRPEAAERREEATF